MAALFKIIRSFQANTIHKILDFNEPNPDLSVDNSSCRLATQTEAWQKNTEPRLAGLHAYGMGGINAHILLEETESRPQTTCAKPIYGKALNDQAELIVLSAKNEDRLRAKVDQLYRFIAARQQGRSIVLVNLAYTLQVGRDPMPERLAFVVNSTTELLAALSAYLDDNSQQSIKSIKVYRANTGNATNRQSLFCKNEAELIQQATLDNNSLETLAAHWVKGGEISWHKLHDGKTLRRMPLPGYPFVMNSYWFNDKPACVAPEADLFDANATTAQQIKDYLLSVLAEALQLPQDQVEVGRHFYDYGIDSLIGMKLLRGLSRTFAIEVQGRELLAYPTVSGTGRLFGAEN